MQEDYKTYTRNHQTVKVYRDGCIVGDRSVLKQRLNASGYPCVTLGHPKKGGRRRVNVHRMVAELFIDNPDQLETVDHINQDKTDNRIENLQWMSREDNVRKGLSRPVVAHRHDGFGYWFPSQSDAGRFGFTQANISQVIRGIRPTCGGFMWRNA